MTQLTCLCGFVIQDQIDNNPDKALLVLDQHLDWLFDDTGAIIADFIRAIAAGARQEWIRAKFGPHYPADITDLEVVHDVLGGAFLLDVSKTVYQCPQCQRLWLQEPPPSQAFHPFVAEHQTHGILAGWVSWPPGGRP